MLYRYLIEIRHKPQYANGAYRRNYQPFDALNPANAILQAVAFCRKNAIDCVAFEVAEGYPVNKRERFKLLKQRQLARENARNNTLERFVSFDPANALDTQAST